MYSLHHRILIVVGLASFATAFNNKFPRATPTLEDYSVNGFTPKPTGDPLLELRKRDPSVCGFASYEPWVSFTCHNGGVCGYNTTVDWWGCCAGQSAGAVTGCAIFTSCVDYTDIGSCAANPECATNSQVVAWYVNVLPSSSTPRPVSPFNAK
ncbi:uncharacterized protein BDZ99DRAFT_464001 [Mytilinidion resinicola]|uniref:Uncharacterized protein n=1 Tax=Mytilinidion resinicola TaxID=574789 RepID=A0A6A6YKZ2_9PEZI|nr:uncharacterized protein BDZ99DRAFT_464001 [Mytilinidion resinicola]KAF2809219.1 hypothetical protein BDZ99DRAFT_464001 [Mytilinidion resinicola]